MHDWETMPDSGIVGTLAHWDSRRCSASSLRIRQVFLGSKKYPDEGEYSAQLALYGGNHNAYTSAEDPTD